MKKMMKFGVLFAISFTALNTFATIRTVSNNVNSPGQYTDLQLAINASADYDTIYIHRSETSYGAITIKKPIILIGEGAMPNKQVQLTYTSGYQISSINLTHDYPASNGSASGSKFYGLNVSSVIIGAASGTIYNVGVSNLIFNRNKIGSCTLNYIHTNLVFTQNTISTITSIGYSSGSLISAVVSNNIISYFGPTWSENYAGASNLISNNIFGSAFFARGAVVSNNIFYESGTSLSINTTSCTFNNNIFYAYNPVSSSNIISASNSGTGNLFNVNPQFTTPSQLATVCNYNYTNPTAGPFANFHLLSSSPGLNYGTDGTDIGLYGGAFPWVDGSTIDSRFRYYPLSGQVPQIIEMNIINSTIQQNGTLNVNFNAKSQN